MQFARDELAAPGTDAADIELGRHAFGDQRRQITLVDQVAHRDLVGDVGEDRVIPFVQQAGIQAERRGGEADHLEQRVDPLQPVEETAVHGVGRARNQMRFVDQHQVALLHVVDAFMNRLDPGK